MYFYESFAGDFDSKMNMYDTQKRLDVVFNELLTEDIKDLKLLDGGCGTGWFSKAAAGNNLRPAPGNDNRILFNYISLQLLNFGLFFVPALN